METSEQEFLERSSNTRRFSELITPKDVYEFINKAHKGDRIEYVEKGFEGVAVYKGINNISKKLRFVHQLPESLEIYENIVNPYDHAFEDRKLIITPSNSTFFIYSPDSSEVHWGESYGVLKFADQWKGGLRKKLWQKE